VGPISWKKEQSWNNNYGDCRQLYDEECRGKHEGAILKMTGSIVET
jgi:hypothetical protein